MLLDSSKMVGDSQLELSGDPTGNLDAAAKQYVDYHVNSVRDPSFASITAKPSSVSGYGITDVYTKSQIDTMILGSAVGLLNDRGSYNASSNTFPTTGGSGPSGAIVKGDLWYVSVAGTLGAKAVNVGDSFRAMQDLPGQISSNWSVLEGNIGYVPYNSTNPDGFISNVIVTGDAVGSGTVGSNTVNVALNLAGTAGTYTKVTTDTKGRVISGANLAAADVPTLDWTKIGSGKPTTLSGYGITDSYTKTEVDNHVWDWSDVTTGRPTTLSGYGIADAVKNKGGWPSVQQGNDAAKPMSGNTTGDFYWALDTGLCYRWSGSAWSFPSQPTGSTLVAGSYGSATQVGTFTVNAGGALTAAANVTVTPGWTSITSKPTTINGFGLTDALSKSQALSLTGDVISTSKLLTTGSLSTTLAPSGVTAGIYTQVTVDSKGRVTYGVAPTTLSGYGITDTYTKAEVDSKFSKVSNVTTTAVTGTVIDHDTIANVFARFKAEYNAGSGLTYAQCSVPFTAENAIRKTVGNWYKNTLGHPGDQAGVNYWTTQLSGTGGVPVSVYTGAYETTWQQCWIPALGRPANRDLQPLEDLFVGLGIGPTLSDFVTAYSNNSGIKDMFDSWYHTVGNEGYILYNGTTDTQFVTMIYQNALNRDPTAGELAPHLAGIADGSSPRGVMPFNLASQILALGSGTDYLTFTKKVTVATAFTRLINNSVYNDVYGQMNDIAHFGTTRTWLKNVTSTTDTTTYTNAGGLNQLLLAEFSYPDIYASFVAAAKQITPTSAVATLTSTQAGAAYTPEMASDSASIVSDWIYHLGVSGANGAKYINLLSTWVNRKSTLWLNGSVALTAGNNYSIQVAMPTGGTETQPITNTLPTTLNDYTACTLNPGFSQVPNAGAAYTLLINGVVQTTLSDYGITDSESTLNKATDFSVVNNTKYPSVQAVKTYADGLVAGLLDDRGSYNASVNTWPTTGGSGTAGAVMKGDLWYVSVAGTLGGNAVNIGDSFRAVADAPGQTAGNWAVLESNLGFVPANATHNHTVDSLSNVTITSKATNDLIQWNGSAWVNKTIAGAGLQPAGSYLTTANSTYVGTTAISLGRTSLAQTLTGVSIDGSAATATTATHIAGGGAGSIPYQSAGGSTTFVSAGTNTYVLTMVGGVPAWQAPAAGGVSSVNGNTGAVTASQISAAATTGYGFTPYSNANPSGFITGTGNTSGSSGSCTGNAASATTAAACTGTHYVGTTAIAGNRGSAAQALTGITSIDGTAAALVTSSNYQVNGLGVGTAAAAGEVRATGNITAYYSDDRLKDRLGNLADAVKKVCTLNGFRFVNNEVAAQYGYTKQDVQVGVSAQEVEAILPEIVVAAPFDTAFDAAGNMYSISGMDFKTVDYAKLVPLLVEAIKELQVRILDLEAKNT